MPPSAACGFVPCRALDESASRITYRVVRFLGSTIEIGTMEIKLAWKQLAEYDGKTYGPFKAADYNLTTIDGYKTLAGRMTWNSDPARFLVRWSRIIHN